MSWKSAHLDNLKGRGEEKGGEGTMEEGEGGKRRKLGMEKEMGWEGRGKEGRACSPELQIF